MNHKLYKVFYKTYSSPFRHNFEDKIYDSFLHDSVWNQGYFLFVFRYNEMHDRKDFTAASFESFFIGNYLKGQEPTMIYFLILKSCQCCLVVLSDMGSQTFDIYFSFYILCNGNFWSKKLLPCMKKKLFLLWENMSQVFYYDI